MKKLLLNCSMVLALCTFGACGGEDKPDNPNDPQELLDGGGDVSDSGEEDDEKVPCLSKLQCYGDEQCVDGYCTLVSCTSNDDCGDTTQYYCTDKNYCSEYECGDKKACPMPSREGCVDHQCVEYECYDDKPCLDDWMTCSDNHKCVTKEGMCAGVEDCPDTHWCIDHVLVEKECHATKQCPENKTCNENGNCMSIDNYCSDAFPCPGYNYDCIDNQCQLWKCHDNKVCADSSKVCDYGTGQCVAPECTNNDQCANGKECISGLCKQSVTNVCSKDSDCAHDYKCISKSKCVHKESKPFQLSVSIQQDNTTTAFNLTMPAPGSVVVDCGSNGQVVNTHQCKYANKTPEGQQNTIKYYGQINKAQFCQKYANYTIDGNVIFGSSRWTNLDNMFKDCYYVRPITDGVDFQNVTSAVSMFENVAIGMVDANMWDSLNPNKSVDFSYMFKGATIADSSINNWKLNPVTNMKGMFQNAKINTTLTMKKWCGLSDQNCNITNMESMFEGAKCEDIDNFLDIFEFDTSKATNVSAMFKDCNCVVTPGQTKDFSNATTMEQMFYNASNFNANLTNWNVSNVTNMKEMFAYASKFNNSLKNWDVSKVTDMSYMFKYASAFNRDLGSWNVSNVKDMSGMFFQATAFNNGNIEPLSKWKTGNCVDFTGMFSGAISFNSSVNNWDISKAMSMSDMFRDATSFNQPISDWKFGTKTIDATQMFSNASSMKSEISGWKLNLMNGLRFPNTYPCSAMKNYTPANFDLSTLGCNINQ